MRISLMDMLKKLFPFAFTAKADAAALVITFLDYFKVFK